MANKYISTFLAFLLISNVLLATGRHIPKNFKSQDKKEPEWFFGIGPKGLPPKFKLPQYPYTGGGAGAGSGPTGRNYVPGGDDTFVPNPGFEVPNPGTGGGGAPGAPALP